MHGQPRVQRILARTGETFNLIIITFTTINIIIIITFIIISIIIIITFIIIIIIITSIIINGIILIIMLATRAGHHNMIFRSRSADNPISTTSWWF